MDLDVIGFELFLEFAPKLTIQIPVYMLDF